MANGGVAAIKQMMQFITKGNGFDKCMQTVMTKRFYNINNRDFDRHYFLQMKFLLFFKKLCGKQQTRKIICVSQLG